MPPSSSCPGLIAFLFQNEFHSFQHFSPWIDPEGVHVQESGEAVRATSRAMPGRGARLAARQPRIMEGPWKHAKIRGVASVEQGEKRVFKRLNALDFSLLVVILLSIAGFGLARAGYAGVDKVIQGKARIAIDVYLVGFKTIDSDIFKVGEKTSVTVRNQPIYPAMDIVAVKHWQKQVSFLAPDGKKAIAFADPAQPLAHDFLITVSDEAEVTADGYVVRGNKIKVGNLIDLESFKYRVQGVVVDIRPADKQP
jgi:hypothetical protein